VLQDDYIIPFTNFVSISAAVCTSADYFSFNEKPLQWFSLKKIKHLLPSQSLTERRYCAARRHAVTLCVCPPSRLYHVSTARRIRLGGEGNALYPVLSS